MTGGRHYKVVLIDTTEAIDKVLNRDLMYMGFAIWDTPNKHYIDQPYEKSTVSDNPVSSEEEEDEVIYFIPFF